MEIIRELVTLIAMNDIDDNRPMHDGNELINLIEQLSTEQEQKQTGKTEQNKMCS